MSPEFIIVGPSRNRSNSCRASFKILSNCFEKALEGCSLVSVGTSFSSPVQEGTCRGLVKKVGPPFCLMTINWLLLQQFNLSNRQRKIKTFDASSYIQVDVPIKPGNYCMNYHD
ncbi:hypothetical protein NMG60_11026729 [Bertholletia excelsa]